MSPTDLNCFFKQSRTFTEVKQEIIGKFFPAWCANQLANSGSTQETPSCFYIDLKAELPSTDSEKSLLPTIYQSTIQCNRNKLNLSDVVKVFLHNPNKNILQELAVNFEHIIDYQTLSYPPELLNETESQLQLTELLNTEVPAFVVMDPFGSSYAQQMLLDCTTSCQPDLMLLIKPESIVRAFTGKKINPELSQLLGDQVNQIKQFCKKNKSKEKRQQYILAQFQHKLTQEGYLPLTFNINQPDTDHVELYVLFASRNRELYNCFKSTVLPYSCYQQDGVPLFATNQKPDPQLSLFQRIPEFAVVKLAEDLAAQASFFKFKSIEKICEAHSVGTPYILDNYIAAITHLKFQGKVELRNAKTMQAIQKATYSSLVKFL